METNSGKKYLCIFGGGAIRGFAYLGALEALREMNVEIKAYAGSSVGAVFGAFAALGFTSCELRDVFGEVNFDLFKDIQINLAKNFAISKGEFFLEWIRDSIEKKFYGEKTVKSDVGAVIGVMTDSSLIVEEAVESEGGMNMCTALEKLEEKGREEGRLEMKQETVLSMANLGMPVEQIAAVVKESVGIVQKWISEGKAAV